MLVGVSVPLVLLIILAVAVYVPNFFVKPQYNFIYSTISNVDYYYNYYYYENLYKVIDNKIAYSPVSLPANTEGRATYKAPQLFLYDVKTHRVSEISFETAQKLSLDGSTVSLDGYFIEYNYDHSGIFELFGSDSRNSGYYMSNGKASAPLNGINAPTTRSNGVKFIGWVLK